MRDKENLIIGKQPLLSAFKSEDITIERVFIKKGQNDSVTNTIIKKCRQRNIRPEFVFKERLDEASQGENHQGVLAYCSSFKYYEVEDMLALAKERNEDPFIVFLDGIEDPQNLGAIIRSAHLLGAHGVVTEKRNSATLTSSTSKASAGAASFVMCARVTNLKNTIELLKKEGMWFVYADAKGDILYDINLKGPLGVVIGNEAKGVSRLVRESCDFCASIPMYSNDSGIDSFNASVAFGILGSEIYKQRNL